MYDLKSHGKPTKIHLDCVYVVFLEDRLWQTLKIACLIFKHLCIINMNNPSGENDSYKNDLKRGNQMTNVLNLCLIRYNIQVLSIL